MIYLIWFIASASFWVSIIVMDYANIHWKEGTVYPWLHGLLCASTLTAASFVFDL